MNKGDLIEFEKEIMDIYQQGRIKAPVHLSGGNEENLIEIFKRINKNDWIFSNHRNHYHALLKGMNPELLKQEIIAGNSMHLMNKENKIYTSSIVSGQIPIALGTALAIKLKGKKDHVYAFCGDMASEMGIFHECVKYANGHELPITFIVEDNGISVFTNTSEVWGIRTSQNLEQKLNPKIIKYNYNRTYPHHGIGLWVDFADEKPPKDKEYKNEMKKTMKMLGEDSRTFFLGQTVGCKGSPIYETLSEVPLEKRIEMPIMEEAQMGISTGMALEGYIPISIYPRFDFLTLAINQFVNHLDKTHELSHGEFNPKAIVRVMVGSRYPLDGGIQHTQNHTKAFREFLTNTNVKELRHSSEIFEEYKKALDSDKPSLLVEFADLYF
jgi:pyruvate dehydrogenase E1 component alpha subunit